MQSCIEYPFVETEVVVVIDVYLSSHGISLSQRQQVSAVDIGGAFQRLVVVDGTRLESEFLKVVVGRTFLKRGSGSKLQCLVIH